MVRHVYDFAEGGRDLAGLLGGEGANLAEMTRLGLPVPPGFTVTIEACRAFLTTGAEPVGLDRGRAARPDLRIGVCGEHGGDPESIHLFHTAGLDYVSCSPFRVLVARLEAGRAALHGTGTSDTR
jgi:phosphoenolpyruvate synthase/pyruvate phosphate dikinase